MQVGRCGAAGGVAVAQNDGTDSTEALGGTFTSHPPHMLYMIVERFRDGDPVPVYTRFRDRGRLAPPGLEYVNSWVTDDFRQCFQIMECDDRALLDAWIRNWADIVDFDVYAVMPSPEAAAALAPRL